VTTTQLLKTVGVNAIVTLFVSLVFWIPQIQLPKTFVGYILHIFLSTLVGEFCSYWSHRLLHTSIFYPYHKMHHNYIVPNTLVGVYSHPVEMAINFVSVLIGLTLTSSYNQYTLMLESAVVAMGILLSHRADVDLIFDFGAKMHNIHHRDVNCNYGFLIIFDWIFGTLKM
jgi:lathosterol oxidase